MLSLNKRILITILFIGLFLCKNNVYAATITMPTTLEADTTSYVLLSSSGTTPSVSGFSTDLIVNISVTSGTIKITTTAGLTAPTGYNSGEWTGASAIAFEGSQADVNNALATLSYQGSGSASTTLEASATPTGSAYNPSNGHYYEYVNTTGLTWTEAKAATAASTFNGLTGYLATITSAEENDFMESKTTSGDNVFIGATDSASEGVWIWDTGPEAGTQFWSGDSSGSVVGGEYNGWGAGEPSGEDYAEWRSSTGAWNDVNGVATAWTTYIIEYGGLDGETATVESSADITITNTQDNDPLLLSSTPTDDSTGVAVDANIVLTFDKAVDAESGNITIYKTTDDSTVEAIDISSGQVTGSGNTEITINPTSNLDYETEYYVLIDATAFDDSFSNSYAGIISSSTLSFTTEDTPDCPTIDNAETYNAYPTCGVVTCNSGYTLTNGACVASSGGNGYTPPPSIGTGQFDRFIPMYEARPVGEIDLEGTNMLMYIESTANFDAIVSKTNRVQNFNFKILDLDMITKKIKIEILSTQKIMEINIEDSKQVDLDNDEINDIIIIYNELLINRIDLTIEQLEFKQKPVATENEQMVEEKNIFSNGELVKEKDKPTVYLIEYNKKRPFFNEEAFLFNSYKWDDIKTVEDLSFVLTGELIYSQEDNLNVINNKYFFANDLELGIRNNEVKELQKFLNNSGFILAEAGPGSPGNETEYFGELTKQALMEFQKEKGIEPALGYFGPLTRTEVNKY